jgi:hypothetical protein
MAITKFKNKVRAEAELELSQATANRVPVLNSSKEFVSSAVTDTELGYLSGLTSSAQDQIDDAQADATQALSDAADALSAANAAQSDINDHLSDTADAHDASAISIADANTQFTATDVEGALDEAMDAAQAAQADATQALSDASDAQADIDDLISLSGVAANSTNLGTFTGSTIPDSSTIKGALQSLESFVEALPDPMEYKGSWNASTNSPTLANGTGNNGDVYHVSAAGSVDFGAGSISFAIGDKVVYNGSIWEKWDMTDAVSSVNSQTGAVVLEADDIDLASGYAAAAGTVSAADNIQEALQKIDGNAADAQADATQALSDAAAAQSDINDHISDASDAHDASAISVLDTAANFTGTDVEAVLAELQDNIDAISFGSSNDINETSFAMANNQASPANITGFAFANASVRSFEALVSVEIDATADSFESFKLLGVQKGASWDMSIMATGDDSGVAFSITNAGQIQYTSANSAGFSSGAIKFRAIVTSI